MNVQKYSEEQKTIKSGEQKKTNQQNYGSSQKTWRERWEDYMEKETKEPTL